MNTTPLNESNPGDLHSTTRLLITAFPVIDPMYEKTRGPRGFSRVARAEATRSNAGTRAGAKVGMTRGPLPSWDRKPADSPTHSASTNQVPNSTKPKKKEPWQLAQSAIETGGTTNSQP